MDTQEDRLFGYRSNQEHYLSIEVRSNPMRKVTRRLNKYFYPNLPAASDVVEEAKVKNVPKNCTLKVL